MRALVALSTSFVVASSLAGVGAELIPWEDGCGPDDDEECALSLRQLRGQKKAISPDLPYTIVSQYESSSPSAPEMNAAYENMAAAMNDDGLEAVEPSYKPWNPSLASPSGAPPMTFYMYRALSDEVYPPINVNAANIPGVLWYLHHEVVIQYPRKFKISRIGRFKVNVRPTAPLQQLGMNFGPRAAFDRGQCTGPFVCGRTNNSGIMQPKFCDGAFKESYESELVTLETVDADKPFDGAYEWSKFGYFVGCNKLGEYPFPMSPVYYEGATWFSLPGECPSMTFNTQTEECEKTQPGGMCKGDAQGIPTGAGDCTWNYEDMGEVSIDDLAGSADQLNAEGGREYDPLTDKGTRSSFWDGINETAANDRRIKAVRKLFAEKFPDQTLDEDMPSPPCDFNFGKFYKEFWYKNPNEGECLDETADSPCGKMIQWGMHDGVYAHPEWFDGLTSQSSFKDFQRLLFMQGKEACPYRPCTEEDAKQAAASGGN